jgi:hypothetical protein
VNGLHLRERIFAIKDRRTNTILYPENKKAETAGYNRLKNFILNV